MYGITQTFVCRLFGGRDIAVCFDGTNISILGQPIALSSLSNALQAQWQSAWQSVLDSETVVKTGTRGTPGGDNISSAVGEILSRQGAWRNAVQAALPAHG